MHTSSCLECGPHSDVYTDESSKTLWQKIARFLPSSPQVSVVLNSLTLAAIFYSSFYPSIKSD
tara:strand:- start:8250 stop:8438 length:189 start_codon:yes stop_codon:yes gene_type:complete